MILDQFLVSFAEFVKSWPVTNLCFPLTADSESDIDSHPRDKSSSINGKPARVRTVLTEKQLGLLRSCYNMNSRPDALVKEQLVEMTNLSPRVIRVWFQNKRCKDKKKSMEMKLQMQQEKVRQRES